MKIKPLMYNEWIQWLTYEKDENGNAKLKDNAPKKIKEQYEEFKTEQRKRKQIIDD